MAIYRNRSIINQRGASIDLDNTTNQEKYQISHKSGSNILINNVINSELATNNKQTLVMRDKFTNVLNDSSEFVVKNKNQRVGENSTNILGLLGESQIESYKLWKETYRPLAELNSQFKINRGGGSLPNGVNTPQSGSRKANPVLQNNIYTVENTFNGYSGIPVRDSTKDEVVTFATVPDFRKTQPAAGRKLTSSDINKSAGDNGSDAPGVLEFGADKSAATEDGNWSANEEANKIGDKVLEIQDKLMPIEQEMGNGGDEFNIVKKNKFEQVGAIFNDYPTIRVDEKGRSQPFEMLVSDTGIYKNHDYMPHVEEIDNSSKFPCGEDSKIIGNSYVRTVGSGGISLKTTGTTEIGGTVLKMGFKKININANYGIHIGSENGIEIQSLKTITLRTNRQVYVESSLGIKNNLVVGGGIAVEGEVYLHHITAPLEVQQTQDTIVLGKFATEESRTLVIGECNINGIWFPVYAVPNQDLLLNYPHSHHFNNLPLTLCRTNKDVRKFAHNNQINKHVGVVQAVAQIHERKVAKTAS